MKCPQCNGDMWDNVSANDARAEVGEKLRPDYACKDKEGCGFVIWRPKDGSKKILVETPKIEKAKFNEPLCPKVCDSKEKSMCMSYAKDLVVSLAASGTPPPDFAEETIGIYRKLIRALEQ
jgi:hypothetical protein